MTSNLNGLLSLAAGANTQVVVKPSNGTAQSLSFEVAALYAAVAATSGVKATFEVSADGTTYVAAAEGAITAAPAAGVVGSASGKIAFEGPLKRNTTGSIEAVRVTLTNLDATNAATVALLSETNFRI